MIFNSLIVKNSIHFRHSENNKVLAFTKSHQSSLKILDYWVIHFSILKFKLHFLNYFLFGKYGTRFSPTIGNKQLQKHTKIVQTIMNELYIVHEFIKQYHKAEFQKPFKGPSIHLFFLNIL